VTLNVTFDVTAPGGTVIAMPLGIENDPPAAPITLLTVVCVTGFDHVKASTAVPCVVMLVDVVVWVAVISIAGRSFGDVDVSPQATAKRPSATAASPTMDLTCRCRGIAALVENGDTKPSRYG